mmetsp:Transcript_50345/g.116221  ORF Transcript_50345/g.116221 Transcript_50345/m.116221 type:complete len:294 (+) Transcript_50345:278-1159(+)
MPLFARHWKRLTTGSAARAVRKGSGCAYDSPPASTRTSASTHSGWLTAKSCATAPPRLKPTTSAFSPASCLFQKPSWCSRISSQGVLCGSRSSFSRNGCRSVKPPVHHSIASTRRPASASCGAMYRNSRTEESNPWMRSSGGACACALGSSERKHESTAPPVDGTSMGTRCIARIVAMASGSTSARASSPCHAGRSSSVASSPSAALPPRYAFFHADGVNLLMMAFTASLSFLPAASRSSGSPERSMSSSGTVDVGLMPAAAPANNAAVKASMPISPAPSCIPLSKSAMGEIV